MGTLPPIITMGTAAMERRRSTFLTVSSLAMVALATGEAAAMARVAMPKRRAREEEED